MRTMISSACYLAGAWVALCLMAPPAAAGIVMNGTRYVYAEGMAEIAVRVTNKGSLPVLAQAWIDNGDATSAPETLDVPFNLTPPMARLEAGRSQTLRIAYTGEPLPADHESQFWLNVLEVPPKAAESEDTGRIQFAFRYRLKMFYRPKGLKGTADQAAERLVWSRAPGGGVSARNDSDYHVTLNELQFTVGDVTHDVEPFSLAPHSHVSPVLAAPLAAGEVTVAYQSINDYGGFVAHRATASGATSP